MALPKPCRLFFYNHIDFITQESTVPDLRRNVINDKGTTIIILTWKIMVVETFPKTMEEAKAKYDEKFLTKMESCRGIFKI
jgi:hypothetical protein